MVWMIPFCSPVAELSRWLGTQKLSGVDRSAQARQLQINLPHLHPRAPANPVAVGDNLLRLKADFKSHSPSPTSSLTDRLLKGLNHPYLWTLIVVFHLTIRGLCLVYVLLASCFSFLALLDHVSRAHEIEIRPSSVHPSMASIISEVIAWISFKF